MGPLLAAAIPAALSGGLGILGGYQQQRASAREAHKNRVFQERMRDTAWQSAVADMKAAGINPAVAYSRGPAQAPTGSMASQNDIVGSSVTSALQASRIRKELQLLDRQIDSAAAQAQKTQSEKILTDWQAKLLGGTFTPDGRFVPGPGWKQAEANADFAKYQAELRALEIPLMKNLSSIAATPAGKLGAWVQYLLRSIQGGKF